MATPLSDTNETLTRRQVRLEIVQERMSQCTSCVDAGFIPNALPIFQGRAEHRIMIVGQAPGYRTTPSPPYSGATGRTLRVWLARAGFDSDAFHEHFYLTSLTKCFPGPAASGQGDRAPSGAEIRLCAGYLDEELALVQPEVILALGRLSINRFVGRGRLNQVVGNVFEYGDAHVVPLPHPSGVSRWLNSPENRALLDQALEELSTLRVERGLG